MIIRAENGIWKIWTYWCATVALLLLIFQTCLHPSFPFFLVPRFFHFTSSLFTMYLISKGLWPVNATSTKVTNS